jgi:hypothetical protein
MSTRQSIQGATPRFRIGHGAALTALGVLIAVAVTIIILALTSASHTSVATPVTAPQRDGGGNASTAGAGNQTVHYICLVDKFCLRCVADNYCTR